MFQPKLVPGLWGALEVHGPLPDEEIEARARALLGQMTLDEKIAQMSGDTPLLPGLIQMARAYNYEPFPAGENLRLGIPGIRFTDGPRGVALYHSTCFPVPMARGAAWDPDLEERVGDAIGVEARSQGANYFGGVCINLLRHPAWGRAQDTYGEDPYHLGEMGAALVRGVQRHVMACAKHYAANSIENSRMKVDVHLDERTLREVYLPHFKRCVDEGVASVMSAYNRVNGAYCSENSHLLRDILKGEWGLQGFVLSDFVFAVHDGEAAIRAGLDVEMPFTRHYGKKLKRLVGSGRVPEAWIDDAVLRILRQKVRFGAKGEPGRYGPQAVVSAEHRALAREVAVKSMVLLQNDPVPGRDRPLLPIDRGQVKRLAVIGRLAAQDNTGHRVSSRVRPPYVVPPLMGIEAAVKGHAEIIFDRGASPDAAAEAARGAGATIVVVGYTHEDEGEKVPGANRGGDRASLRLAAHDEALIQAVAAANPATAVVLIGGSAIVSEAWRGAVPAILMAWYPGMEGGHALADLLFGLANPSGKLPCTFPRSEAHLPPFDPQADSVEYGYYHGYRLLERDGHEPAFAFGFGLSYTTFRYANLRLDRETMRSGGELQASVEVTNTGPLAGDEIVQWYVGCEGSQVDRPVKELKGLARVLLAPGETRTVSFHLRGEQLATYDAGRGQWTVEPGEGRLWAGGSSRPGDLLAAPFRVEG
jgi:beta-glucosidase